jgi:hypothetical protein
MVSFVAVIQKIPVDQTALIIRIMNMKIAPIA